MIQISVDTLFQAQIDTMVDAIICDVCLPYAELDRLMWDAVEYVISTDDKMQ